MHTKMKEWLYGKGRRLAELKVMGGTEMFQDPETRDVTKLSPNEWAEFLILSGQLDGLIWAYCPEDPDEALGFISEITEMICTFETEAEEIQEITGMRDSIKGYA
jgi:hypothetical protein